MRLIARFPVCLALGILHFLSPLEAAGQAVDEPEPLPPPPGWVPTFTMLSANALVGGVTAGVGQRLRGGSFRDGFTRGFLGGSLVFAGKHVSVERFNGAGLVGRQVAAVGSSMVRNAGEGMPTLEQVVLPLGPVFLYVDRGEGGGVRAKADLNSLVVMGNAVAKRELRFDAGASLSAGAPVWVARQMLFGEAVDTMHASGQVLENVILLSDLPWRTAREAEEIFAHERVHVLQRDQLFIPIMQPLVARLVREVPALEPVHRYVDVHFSELLFRALTIPFPDYEERPWELEAFYLMRR